VKYCWSTITVNNMEESLKFYEDILGLVLNGRFNTGNGGEIAFLGDGETKVELIYNGSGKKVNMGQDISLGFVVDSADAMITFLNEKGISILGGPFQPNPNIKFFYILDPNGLRIQFVENMQSGVL
jgi:lactoylglutathione lyase